MAPLNYLVIFLGKGGLRMKEYEYLVGFHVNDGYEERGMTFQNPVHLGEYILDELGGAEWKVFQITHHPDFSTLHVNGEI